MTRERQRCSVCNRFPRSKTGFLAAMLLVDGEKSALLDFNPICQKCWGTWFPIQSYFPGQTVETLNVRIL